MVMICRYALLAAFLAGFTLANTPLQAQNSATLTVTARVVEQCTISTREQRARAEQRRRTRAPEIYRRCSNGVVGRVNRRSVKVTELRPHHPLPPRVSRKVISRNVIGRASSAGRSDVVLFTVTF